MLGAVNPEASQEDTALTSSVRETIVTMGPDALTPLIAEWRRVQTELADKFSVAPNDRVRAGFVSFTRDYSHPSAIVSAGELTRRAGLLKLDLPENAQAMKVLVSRDTMELIAARRNTLRATADLLRAHDVPQLDFSQLIFNGDFSGAHLKSANLSHADLGGADLSRADLTGANLSKSNLNIAKMAGATLVNANFNELDTGDGADLSGTNLRGATFVRARALRIRLQNADLTNADLTEAAMTEANMSGADLAGARLTRTVLTGADLSNVRNVGAIADIQYANLRSARGLSNADKATTTTRGAQWNETVAIGLDASPSADRFPGPFQQQIRYDERWRALVWTGGKMSPQHYDELRGLSNDVAYMNAVLALRYQTFYASLDTP
jgi:uncharacterized protein YjbI with pentapeptide repeats